MTNKSSLPLAIAALALAGVTAQATESEIVYDNSVNFQNAMTDEGNREIGDQIRINDVTHNIVTQFEFEYNYVRNAGDGSASAQIRFYAMRELDPGVFVPQAEAFAVSPVFNLDVGPGRRIWTDISVTVPETFVWSVRFGGLESGEQAGLLFYNQAGTLGSGPGQSLDDFWRRDSQFDNWGLFDTAGLVDNFAARVTAVPEPSTFALLGGAAALLGLRRRKA